MDDAHVVKLKLPNGTEYDQPTALFIDNQWILPEKKEKVEVVNPSTGEVISTVHTAGEKEVELAVAAARRAFEGEWSELPALERGNLLYKIAELIHRDRELLAGIDAWDNGKPYSVALDEDLTESYNVFKYYAGFADKIYGKTIETDQNKFAYVRQEPLGVCAQIIPWYIALPVPAAFTSLNLRRNFPFMMLAWKIAPALACGNTVVLKSAEQTPLSALVFGKLILEAGFPPGVVNILTGYGKVAGSALAHHMDVDKIAFTGSTATGRAIMKAASDNLKNITLECGGKSPSIVFADADLDQAVKWTHLGIMYMSGQVCTSTSRIYVEESIYEDFLKRFVEYTKAQSVMGDPFDENTFHGPQVSQSQLDKISNYIEQGKKDGARLLIGGSKPERRGFFVDATVFADVKEEMLIMKDEIFGPVVAIASFKTEAEVVKKANDTSYGLAAALFSENITKAHKVAAKLQAGMVWINSSNDSHFGIPFGGYKSSGIGRELGPYALDAYTQSKAVHVNLGNRL